MRYSHSLNLIDNTTPHTKQHTTPAAHACTNDNTQVRIRAQVRKHTCTSPSAYLDASAHRRHVLVRVSVVDPTAASLQPHERCVGHLLPAVDPGMRHLPACVGLSICPALWVHTERLGLVVPVTLHGGIHVLQNEGRMHGRRAKQCWLDQQVCAAVHEQCGILLLP